MKNAIGYLVCGMVAVFVAYFINASGGLLLLELLGLGFLMSTLIFFLSQRKMKCRIRAISEIAAKKELFENPAMNLAMKHLNAFPVVRGIGDMKAVNYGIELVKRGEVLVIFPEGTRSEDGVPHEPKSGVGYIARATESDVVPAAIYIDKEKKKTIVNFGKVIKFEELGIHPGGKSKENKAAAALVMNRNTELWEECK